MKPGRTMLCRSQAHCKLFRQHIQSCFVGTDSRNGRDAVSASLKLGTATCCPSWLLPRNSPSKSKTVLPPSRRSGALARRVGGKGRQDHRAISIVAPRRDPFFPITGDVVPANFSCRFAASKGGSGVGIRGRGREEGRCDGGNLFLENRKFLRQAARWLLWM